MKVIAKNNQQANLYSHFKSLMETMSFPWTTFVVCVKKWFSCLKSSVALFSIGNLLFGYWFLSIFSGTLRDCRPYLLWTFYDILLLILPGAIWIIPVFMANAGLNSKRSVAPKNPTLNIDGTPYILLTIMLITVIFLLV